MTEQASHIKNRKNIPYIIPKSQAFEQKPVVTLQQKKLTYSHFPHTLLMFVPF